MINMLCLVMWSHHVFQRGQAVFGHSRVYYLRHSRACPPKSVGHAGDDRTLGIASYVFSLDLCHHL